MTAAHWSLAALALAVVVSCFTEMNVGVLALALAGITGVTAAGMKPEQVLAGFPVPLFVTLSGVMLLFTQAQLNGTLERVAQRSLRLARGRVGWIPVLFFAFGSGLATIGAGNVAAGALLAPIAMAVGGRAGVPAFLMAIMLGTGVGSGGLSPVAPTGVIVNDLMSRIGVGGREWEVWAWTLAAHAIVAAGGYIVFGGFRLFGRRWKDTSVVEPFQRNHWVTLGALAAMMTSVIAFRANVGLASFAAAAVLMILGAADHKQAIQKMPWSVIVMVCGVTVLITLVERTQGMELFSRAMASISSPESATAVAALITGAVSVFSSTSGVVLPAFLPVVPGMVKQLGGGDPFHIAMAMNVGGHLVDVSPLSTIGALCLAAAPATEDSRLLFRKLLLWGLSMTVAGALLCWGLFR